MNSIQSGSVAAVAVASQQPSRPRLHLSFFVGDGRESTTWNSARECKIEREREREIKRGEGGEGEKIKCYTKAPKKSERGTGEGGHRE